MDATLQERRKQWFGGEQWHWHAVETVSADGETHSEWVWGSPEFVPERAAVLAGPGGSVTRCERAELPERVRREGWQDGDPVRSYQGGPV